MVVSGPFPLSVRIDKTETTSREVTIHLSNGVKVDVVSHAGYLHIHFSGIKDGVVAGLFHHLPPDSGVPTLQLPNHLDVSYEARDDERSQSGS